MIGKYILPRTGIRNLGRALDAYSARQRTTAENVANVQTPGYRSKQVSFEENLSRASRNQLGMAPVQQPPGSIPLTVPNSSFIEIKEVRSDYDNGINDVNMEKEMTDMAKTSLAYNMVAKLTKGTIETIRSAISGKGR